MGAGRKSVVITGCSVGAGRAAAFRMARAGWQVFAAVRRAEDAAALEKEAPGLLRAFLCDVREREQVFEMARAKLPGEAEALYGDMLDRMSSLSEEMEGSGKEPEEVAETYYRALTEPRPRDFYTVGRDAKGLRLASRLLPMWVRKRLADRIMRG